jgi:hypothetical protein
MCLACGHEAGSSPVPHTSSPTVATVGGGPAPTPAPAPAQVPANPFTSGPSTAIGASATQTPAAPTASGMPNPFTSGSQPATPPLGTANDPFGAGAGAPKPITGIFDGPMPNAPSTSGPGVPSFQPPSGAASMPLPAAQPPPSTSGPALVPPSTSGPAIPASVVQQRCPDCGRLITGGDCVACGWRQPLTPSDVAMAPSPVTGVGMPQPDFTPPSPPVIAAPVTPPPAEVDPLPQPATSAGGLAARTPMVEARAPLALPELSVPLPRLIAVAAATFVLTVGIGALIMFSGGSTPEGSADMTREEAAEVLSAIELISDRTGEQYKSLGHAYFTLDRYEDGLDAFVSAAKLGVVDDDVIEQMVGVLNDPLMRERAINALLALPAKSGVDAVLSESLDDPKFEVRHAAFTALERRGAATTTQHVSLAIKDLLEAGTCERRRDALFTLQEITTGEDRARAIEAIQAAEEAPVRMRSCMLPHFVKVKKAIMTR